MHYTFIANVGSVKPKKLENLANMFMEVWGMRHGFVLCG